MVALTVFLHFDDILKQNWMTLEAVKFNTNCMECGSEATIIHRPSYVLQPVALRQ